MGEVISYCKYRYSWGKSYRRCFCRTVTAKANPNIVGQLNNQTHRVIH